MPWKSVEEWKNKVNSWIEKSEKFLNEELLSHGNERLLSNGEQFKNVTETLEKEFGLLCITNNNFISYANAVKEYQETIGKSNQDSFKNVQTFIDGSWKNYKTFKETHDKKIEKYIEIIKKLSVKVQKETQQKTDKQVKKENKRLEKEKKQYSKYLNKAEKNLKKEISGIEPILAENGITMVRTLQNLIHHNKSEQILDLEKNTESKKNIESKKKFGFWQLYVYAFSAINAYGNNKRTRSAVLKKCRAFLSGAYNSAFGGVTKSFIKTYKSYSLQDFTKKVKELTKKLSSTNSVISYLDEFITRSENEIKETIYPYYDTLLNKMMNVAVNDLNNGKRPLSKFKFKIIADYINKKQNKIFKTIKKDCINEYKKDESYSKKGMETLKNLINAIKKIISIKILSEYNIPEVSPLLESVLKGARIAATIGASVVGIFGAWIGLKMTASLWATILEPETFIVVIFSFGLPLLGGVLTSVFSGGLGAVVGGAIGAAAGAPVGAFFGGIWHKIYSKGVIKNFKKEHEKSKNLSQKNISFETPADQPAAPLIDLDLPETPTPDQ